MTAAEAIASRRSVRAFLPTPVDHATVERLLALAARAPSGTNTQPWRVYAVAGETRRRLCSDLVAAYLAAEREPEGEYAYYPTQWFEPYLSRRRKVGWDLYALLGIGRGESERMRRQHARNLEFFGAPVGLIVTVDRRLERGSWIDLGMFVQTLLIAARGEGLDTCPQAAFKPWHAIIRAHLPIPAEEVVVCGVALGMADPEAAENGLVAERAGVGEFATFMGWP